MPTDLHATGALVTGYEDWISLLPDSGDRHVLAAASRGHCGVIVTMNRKDFPYHAIEPFGLEALFAGAPKIDTDVFVLREYMREKAI